MNILHRLKLRIKAFFRADHSLTEDVKGIHRYTVGYIGLDGKLHHTHHHSVTERLRPVRSILEMTAKERDEIMRRK